MHFYPQLLKYMHFEIVKFILMVHFIIVFTKDI